MAGTGPRGEKAQCHGTVGFPPVSLKPDAIAEKNCGVAENAATKRRDFRGEGDLVFGSLDFLPFGVAEPGEDSPGGACVDGAHLGRIDFDSPGDPAFKGDLFRLNRDERASEDLVGIEIETCLPQGGRGIALVATVGPALDFDRGVLGEGNGAFGSGRLPGEKGGIARFVSSSKAGETTQTQPGDKEQVGAPGKWLGVFGEADFTGAR